MGNKRRGLSTIAFALVFLLIFQSSVPKAFGMDGAEVHSLLKNIKAVVLQNGVEVGEDDEIDAAQPIEIVYSFDVPVIGDEPEPAEYVMGGDIATFDLPNGLTLVNSASQELDFGGEVVGEVVFAGSQATVTFSELVDDESIYGVSANFEAEMTYDASGVPEEGGEYEVTILDKTFTVIVPPKQVTISGEKTGVADITNKKVDWTVEVTATVEGGGEGKLKDYVFLDDLSGVGAYVTDSFKIGQSEDGSDANAATPDYLDETLSYTFPEGYQGTYYLFFQTEISDSMIYSTDAQNISNSAEIYKDSELKATLEDTVSFQMEWIEKNGVVVIGSEGSSESYDASARKIQWTIQANQMGAVIENAVITDTLPTGLTFESATIAYRNVGDADWGAESAIVPVITEQELTFSLGNDLSGKECLITLVTGVDDTNPASTIQKYENTATLTGDNLPGEGFESNTSSVNIGFNPISKSGGSYNNSTHKMNWSVTVNTKNQLYAGNLRVLDLLVYGTSFPTADFSSLDTGSELSDITYADLQNLTPRYNQKYAENFSGDGLSITVHHLEKDGKIIADVLVITKDDGTGLDYTKANTFSYDTLVTNPDIYASNQTTKIYNTATIFSGNFKLNETTAEKSITSNMLKKDMLTRSNAIAFEANMDNLTPVNASASGATGAYRYDDNSVIFRIHVNTNGLTDATNDVTTVEGETLGNFVVTDTLPDGWEFKPLNGKDFLLYEKSGSPLNAIAPEIEDYSPFLSSSGITAPTEDLGGTITFEFSQLTKPYVILVKAGPTQETVEDYFDENGTYNLVNNVAMANTHFSNGKAPKDTEAITVTSQLLNKSYTVPETGTLLWTVDYKPYNISHENAYIEDVLPLGLDLPMDAQGNLILEGNIKMIKLNMAVDGSYSAGDEITLPAGQEIITYNNATRTLHFALPDSQQAYRLTYKTDITGNPGATMTNSVALYTKQISNEEIDKQYVITNVDASATFSRGGWLKITKVDQSSIPLAGAEFTLFAEDGTTAIKKGISGSNGIVQLKTITPGEYILQETKAPDGYNISAQTYTVSVVKDDSGIITTSINDTGLNTITVKNILTGTVGDLKISKTVAGNAGDTTKAFTFIVNFTGVDGTFSYTKTGGVEGTIQSGDSITLTHGQSITITGIPKDVTYTVTENNYSQEGYTTVANGDSGTIIADETQVASFTNTKHKSSGGGGDITPEVTKGSVKVIKFDSQNSSKTLAGAVFKLLDENKSVIKTSEKTGEDGEITFDDLELGEKYYLREKVAPEGYKLTDKEYSFRLTNQEGAYNITIEVENDKIKDEETKPIDPNIPETPPTTEIADGDVPKDGTDKKKNEELYEINPDGIPTTGIFDEDVPSTSKELDDTPKTGSGLTAKEASVALSILSTCGLFLLAVSKKRFKLR